MNRDRMISRAAHNIEFFAEWALTLNDHRIESPTVRYLAAPFGGARNSGIGREGGNWSMDFYCDVKNVSIKKKLIRIGEHLVVGLPSDRRRKAGDRCSAQVAAVKDDGDQSTLKRILSAAVTASALLSGSAQAQPAPVSVWSVPSPDTLPEDAFGRTVRAGRDLIVKTSSLIGPDATDPARRYGGNGLDCQSCHLQAGTQRFGLPLAGVWGVFPSYIAREDDVRTLEQRINGCMERSMNGKALPLDGPEMIAMLTYIKFISGSERVGQPLDGRGAPALPLPETESDPRHGRQVYAATCAVCHGPDGHGQRLDPEEARQAGRRYRYPPLWGQDSFNDGAGMARAITAAQFVHANMPFGTTSDAPALSAAEAFDVSAYIDGQPRPHKADLEADFPDRARKPVDAAYPPFVGPFSAEQHRLGPWKPIQAWINANGAAARIAD